MTHPSTWLAALVFLWAGIGGRSQLAGQESDAPYVVETPPQSPETQRLMFHLPDGFQIDLVAAEPELVNPINMNFAADGSLYVTQSVEYPIPVPPDRPGRDRLLRIADTEGDGVPDQVSTAADGLNIPIGVTPVPGGLLAYSIPQLYFFSNGSGDGRNENREVRFGEFGYDDTHGMVSSLTWWIDGWIYGCHGFVNKSHVAGTDGGSITMKSGNTYRLQPDGSQFEHWAHGQVNPFGLTFDPWGNLFTADCHTRPATMVQCGAHYPRSPGDGLGMGPELMQHAHGSTGIAGIVYYAADRFPETYWGSLFIGNPITGRINHDLLKRHGSTYRAVEQPDFLSCDDPWFRPVDLQLGPDGALYIADMYNAVIAHYEVPLHHQARDRQHGRIWRVSYRGKRDNEPSPPTDLTVMDVDELIARLADSNLTVRTLATHELAERIGPHALAPVQDMLGVSVSPEQRAHGLWVIQRLGALTTVDWKPLLTDPSPLVRVHAVKVLAEQDRWDADMRDSVLSRLDDEGGFVRRAAVEAIGRHPHEVLIEPLVQLLASADPLDTFLVHAARIALRDNLAASGRFEQIEQQFADSEWSLEILADVALGIPSSEAADLLWHRFHSRQTAEEDAEKVLRHVVQHTEEGKLPKILAFAETATADEPDRAWKTAVALHQGFLERGLPMPPRLETWGERLARPLLESSNEQTVYKGLELIARMQLTSLGSELARLSRPDSPFPGQRPAAVKALEMSRPPEMVPAFFRIMNDEQDTAKLRQYVAEQLGSNRNPEVRQRVLKRLPTASHLIMVGLSRGLAVDAEGTTALLDLMERGQVSRLLLQDRKVQRLMTISRAPGINARMQKLMNDLPSLDEQIQQTIDERRLAYLEGQPDAARGVELFRKHCAVCHRLDNQGERIGPELDGIGTRGLDRLLEDLLDPNRNVGEKYRATVIVTGRGLVLTGLVVQEEYGLLVLADQTGKTHRIPRSHIAERRQLNASAMPTNADEILTPTELSALLAYLVMQTDKRPQ